MGEILNGASCTARLIKEMGVKRVYGVVGTSVLPLINALKDVQESVKYVSARHEQVAASMADAEGRLGEIPGIVITHSGPGTLNAAISLAIAYKDCSPMICISGAVPRAHRGKDGFLDIEHGEAFKGFLSGAYMANSTAELPKIFEKAFEDAMGNGRGPVLVEIPEDLWREEAEIDLSALKFKGGTSPRIGDQEFETIWGMIKEASRPVILAGGGVISAGASQDLTRFAETLNIPVITTGNGRGGIPEDHSHCFGRCGYAGGNPAADSAFAEADLLLVIGATVSDMSTYDRTRHPAGKVVMVNLNEKWLRKNIEPAAAIHGNARDFLRKILKVSPGDITPKGDDWINTLQAKKDEWKGTLDMLSSAASEKVNPSMFMRELEILSPEDSIFTTGQGMHLLYPNNYICIRKPGAFISSNNFGAMGFGMPAAMAACLCRPGATGVAILGDGDFMMTIQDIETAVREKLNLKVFVLNDFAYRVLLTMQKMAMFEKGFGTEHGNPDFARLAKTFGAKGFRIEKNEEIRERVEAAFAEEGPVIVDVLIDADSPAPLNLEAIAGMGKVGR